MSSPTPQAGPGAAGAQPILLICSSSEAIKRGIVPSLVWELDSRKVAVQIKSWNDEFPDGEFTLETLLRLADQIDLAVLIFSKDDERNIRGQQDNVARDNVLLEYGLFLGKLGRSRVFIFLEEDVTPPSDIKGLTVSVFKKTNESVFGAAVHHFVTRIEERLPVLSPLARPEPRTSGADIPGVDIREVAAELGIGSIFKDGQGFLDELKDKVSRYASDGKPSSKEPFHITSSRLCIATYAEALDLVKKRFWTTSYLSSGFWVQQKESSILEANKRMLEQLNTNRDDARRLFLVERPLAEELQVRKQDYIHLRHQSQHSEIEKKNRVLRELKDTFEKLKLAGCEVKVAHENDAHLALPAGIDFKKGDSEVAIYDDFRVDYFSGGEVGSITGVKIYSKATDFFQVILDKSKDYFEALWNEQKTKDIIDFLNELEAAYDAADKQIDYTSDWRAEFEYNLRPEDENLKTEELNTVKEVLNQFGRWGKVQRYLDIGTGTARYPIGLREGVADRGKIIGIDNDVACISFAKGQKQRKANNDPRIDIKFIDFGANEITTSLGSFDLITCMLGTISHFGRNKKQDLTDELQTVIRRVQKLLQKDGIFIVSNWSQYACSQLDMIQIYKEYDKKRLAAWTPDRTDLRRRIEETGMVVLEEIMVESRLEIFVCRQK